MSIQRKAKLLALDLIKAVLSATFLIGSAGAAQAADAAAADSIQFTPLLDARLRYEHVEQPVLDANALTFRLRAGVEAKLDQFSVLGELEGTAPLVDHYNAFPFPLPGNSQWRPDHSVVADSGNIELNRLQLQYKGGPTVITLGRQRINLDDQRWVGSVGWRQNEQTFDALRAESKLGPVGLDMTFATKQRTIFGTDAGPRTAYDGRFLFAGALVNIGPVQAKAFAYLLDYDETFFLANSSQSYGIILNTSVPLGGKRKLALRGSYARQSDFGDNPFNYSADYISGEAGTAIAGFALTAGWEKLGSDNGRGLQTPMATLHKFNGWADLFLTTPTTGLEDGYVTVIRKFERIKAIPGLNAAIAFHQFDSAVGNIEYGTEWDMSVGMTVRRVAIVAKFASYDARDFGVDTRKFWLQAEWKL